MSAPQGWYDAGVPGRLRWWDGTQWTAHERAATPTAPMGWYPVVGTSDVRWWDGAVWTPYRLRGGTPRPDAFANEPESNGLVLGFVFIVLAITQLSTRSFSDQPFFTFLPVLFLVTGVLWLIGGWRMSQLSKQPAPSTVPVFEPSTRPLPGEVEGAGAGWFAVSGFVTRWWTGTRWSEYVGQKFGVRPTQYGDRTYRVSMIIGWILAVLGVIGTVLGFVLIYALDRWVGTSIVIPAMICILIGGILLPIIYLRRYTLILPPTPPPLR